MRYNFLLLRRPKDYSYHAIVTVFFIPTNGWQRINIDVVATKTLNPIQPIGFDEQITVAIVPYEQPPPHTI